MKNPFVLTNTDDGPMLVNLYDKAIGAGLIVNGNVEGKEIDDCFHLIESKRSKNGNGVIIIDVGANIGTHSISWAKRMDGWGIILAVEAQIVCFYALCGNLVLNNCWNIDARWAVVGKEDGLAEMPVVDIKKHANFGGVSMIDSRNDEYKGKILGYKRTPAIRLDTLELPRLDFLKIDVEGMEMDVVEGGLKTIEKFRPTIVAEANNSLEDWKGKLPDFYSMDWLNEGNYVFLERS